MSAIKLILGMKCGYHPDRNAFAMKEEGKGKGLNGVTDRVAVVENAADAAFICVHHHNFGLGPCRPMNDFAEQTFLPVVQNAIHVGLQQLEKLRVSYYTRLDDLKPPPSARCHNTSTAKWQQRSPQRGHCRTPAEEGT